jgi:hypothetical protein
MAAQLVHGMAIAPMTRAVGEDIVVILDSSGGRAFTMAPPITRGGESAGPHRSLTISFARCGRRTRVRSQPLAIPQAARQSHAHHAPPIFPLVSASPARRGPSLHARSEAQASSWPGDEVAMTGILVIFRSRIGGIVATKAMFVRWNILRDQIAMASGGVSSETLLRRTIAREWDLASSHSLRWPSLEPLFAWNFQ